MGIANTPAEASLRETTGAGREIPKLPIVQPTVRPAAQPIVHSRAIRFCRQMEARGVLVFALAEHIEDRTQQPYNAAAKGLAAFFSRIIVNPNVRFC